MLFNSRGEVLVEVPWPSSGFDLLPTSYVNKVILGVRIKEYRSDRTTYFFYDYKKLLTDNIKKTKDFHFFTGDFNEMLKMASNLLFEI
ncbi:hypothetical protein EfmAA818_27330 [Enterococcus faecium]|nr:hypothetical protein EfmAA818_27330 [Enterococcus faecium]